MLATAMVKHGTMRTALTLATLLGAGLSAQDHIPGISPTRARDMLRQVREAVERHCRSAAVSPKSCSTGSA